MIKEILNRRAVREYSEKPVSDEDEKMLFLCYS